MSEQISVAPLLALMTLALAVPVTRWFSLTVQRLVILLTHSPAAALYVYHALLLPGTILHELSHLAVAWILRVPAGKLTLLPGIESSGSARLGSVQIAQVDPVRESLIGLAPLVSGLAAIVLITSRVLRLPAADVLLAEPQAAVATLANVFDAALWLYPLLAIGNTMLPSAADRRAWLAGAAIVALLAGALYLLGVTRIPQAASVALYRGAAYAGTALALIVLIDLLAGALIWLVMCPWHA